MARRPRIDLAGYHHIVNRGVNRMEVFSDENDKETFLQILCKACRIYGVTIHDYCLMDNHYHLLIENQISNLSLFMRQVNANYAIYYNKKAKRTGHLWQGRFSSWYITNNDYLYRTVRYIEYNPIEAKMANRVGEYAYTLGSVILRGEEIPSCTKGSILVNDYDISILADFLDEPLSDEEINVLEEERKKVLEVHDGIVKPKKKKPLESYFDESMDKEMRNKAIFEAYMDGHTQLSISKHLNLSDAMISIIVKKFRI